MIADGCIIDGCVENSIISRNVRIAKGAVVKNCIIMQGTEVGAGAQIEFCITDNLVNISADVTLRGAAAYPTVLPKGCKV